MPCCRHIHNSGLSFGLPCRAAILTGVLAAREMKERTANMKLMKCIVAMRGVTGCSDTSKSCCKSGAALSCDALMAVIERYRLESDHKRSSAGTLWRPKY